MSKLLDTLQLNSFEQPLITIDVGVNTGICLYSFDKIISTRLLKEDKVYKTMNIADRVNAMADDLDNVLYHILPSEAKIALIEGVQVYGTSQKSMTSTLSGDTIFLSYLVGAYANVCKKHSAFTRIVLPRQWKGNMNKDVVKARIQRVTGTVYNEHIADAVGMMLSLRGML